MFVHIEATLCIQIQLLAKCHYRTGLAALTCQSVIMACSLAPLHVPVLLHHVLLPGIAHCFAAVCRLIRAVGHKLKRIGALAHPLRAEKDEDVVMGAHTLTGVEELLENCFQALENYTGQSAVLGSVVWLPARSAEGSVHPFHRSCAFSFLGLEILWETVSKFCIT